VFISLPVKLLKTIIFSLMPRPSPSKMDRSNILSETGEDGKGPDEETTQEPDEETELEPEKN
jgi:hypothetical protein